MNEAQASAILPAFSECVSLEIATKRIIASTHYSQPNVSVPGRPDMWVHAAFYEIQKHLRTARIIGYAFDRDIHPSPMPVSFWTENGTRRLEVVDGKIVHDESFIREKSGFVFERDAAQIFIVEREFERLVECLVHPLPASKMPTGLLFIAQFDGDDNEISLTYMSIEDALSAFSAQRKAYIQEEHKDNWSFSQSELRRSLEGGTVRSFHRNGNGFVRMLNPCDWRIDGPIIGRITRGKRYHDEWCSFVTIQTETGPDNGQVIVLRSEINDALKNAISALNLIDVEDGSLEIPGSYEQINSYVGRPKTHDSELFVTIAFKLIWETPGFPRDQADLIRRTLPEYEAARAAEGYRGDPPKDTWVKKRASLLWKRLELSRKVGN